MRHSRGVGTTQPLQHWDPGSTEWGCRRALSPGMEWGARDCLSSKPENPAVQLCPGLAPTVLGSAPSCPQTLHSPLLDAI